MKKGAVTGVLAPRRGVELSLNTVILMVIALIVMGIIIYLVATNTGRANKDLGDCASKGGVCKSSCGPGETGSTFFTTGKDCEGMICCRSSPWEDAEK